MFVLILMAVIVVALVFVAYSRRISWFDVVEWEEKEYPFNSVNGGRIPYAANAKLRRAKGELSIINDGYGSNDRPYEIWEESADQMWKKQQGIRIEWEDYEDVEGWLTEEEVCNVIREWF